MGKSLTIARTMPTILRPAFEDVVVVDEDVAEVVVIVSERANIPDVSSTAKMVDTLSALVCGYVRGFHCRRRCPTMSRRLRRRGLGRNCG